MLYVSRFDQKKQKYGITDTDDGTTEFMSKAELLSAAKEVAKLGLSINGVSGSQISIVTLESQVMDSADGFGRIEKMVDELVSGWSVETCMEVARAGSFVKKIKGKPASEVTAITKSYVYPDSIRNAVKNAAQYTNSFHEVDVHNPSAIMDALVNNVCLVLQQKTNGILTSFVCSGGLAVLDKVYAPGFFDAVYLTKQLYGYTYEAAKLRPYKSRETTKNPNMLNVFSCSLRFRNDGVRHDKGEMVISSPFYSVNLAKVFCVYILDNPIKLGDTLKGEFKQRKSTGLYKFDFNMFRDVMNDVKTGINSFIDPKNFLRYLNQSNLPNGVTLQDVMDRYTRDWNYMQHLRSTGISFSRPN